MGAPGTTPGPWAADVEIPRLAAVRGIVGASSDVLVIRDAHRFWLAIPCDGGRDSAEVRANAHQMAASGALYDALVAMTRVFMPHPREDTEGWREEHEAFEEAMRALRQARGEPS